MIDSIIQFLTVLALLAACRKYSYESGKVAGYEEAKREMELQALRRDVIEPLRRTFISRQREAQAAQVHVTFDPGTSKSGSSHH